MDETCGHVKLARSRLIGAFGVNGCVIRVTGQILPQEAIVRKPYVCTGAGRNTA